jgi:hypothetical protein
MIPHEGNNSISIFGSEATGPVSLAQFSDYFTARFYDIPVNPNTQDTITTNSDENKITYQAGDVKKISIEFSVENPQRSYDFQLKNADISKGSKLSIQANLDQGVLYFNNTNSSEGSYDLQIRRVDANGDQTAAYTGIPIDANITQAINLAGWDPNKPLSYSIDANNDGQFETQKEVPVAGQPTQPQPIANNTNTMVGIVVIVLGVGLLGFVILRLWMEARKKL